jgi:quercetin dioxygenase-like cupin family protein
MPDDTDEERLREHPRDRFAPRERIIDLHEVFDQLAEEPHDAIDGHRQMTIDREGPLTLIAFHFEEEATLPKHVVDGAVEIQVLEGSISVNTEEGGFNLEAFQMLTLDPGVPHSLRANEASRVLVTVFLES